MGTGAFLTVTDGIAAVWNSTLGQIIGGFTPLVGEQIDWIVIFAKDSTPTQRAVAGFSLLVSVGTGTLAPNIGGWYKGWRGSIEVVDDAGRLVGRTLTPPVIPQVGKQLSKAAGEVAEVSAKRAGSFGLKPFLKEALGMTPGQAGTYLGWGRGAILKKGIKDFTRDQLIKDGFTKKKLEKLAEIYEGIAGTLSPKELANHAAPARADQLRKILENLF